MRSSDPFHGTISVLIRAREVCMNRKGGGRIGISRGSVEKSGPMTDGHYYRICL